MEFYESPSFFFFPNSYLYYSDDYEILNVSLSLDFSVLIEDYQQTHKLIHFCSRVLGVIIIVDAVHIEMQDLCTNDKQETK